VHRRRRASLPDEPSVARAQAKLEKREEKEEEEEEEEEEEDKKSAVGVAQPAVPGRAVATSASSPPPSSPPPPLQVPATPPPTVKSGDPWAGIGAQDTQADRREKGVHPQLTLECERGSAEVQR